jgi:hypothetical protein
MPTYAKPRSHLHDAGWLLARGADLAPDISYGRVSHESAQPRYGHLAPKPLSPGYSEESAPSHIRERALSCYFEP